MKRLLLHVARAALVLSPVAVAAAAPSVAVAQTPGFTAPTIAIEHLTEGQEVKIGDQLRPSFSCASGRPGAPVASCLATVRYSHGTPVAYDDDTNVPTDQAGEYLYTVTATDEEGRTSQQVRSYSAHDRPVPKVIAPGEASSFKVGAQAKVDFACTTTTREVSCRAFVNESRSDSWTELQAGENLPTTAVGRYVVTVQAFDSLSQLQSVTREYVVGDPPRVTLTGIEDGARYGVGQAPVAKYACAGEVDIVSCQGSVTYGSYQPGRLRSDELLPSADAGSYVVAVTAVDQFGRTVTEKRTYTVFAPPTIRFSSPSESGRIPQTGTDPAPTARCEATAGLEGCAILVTAPDDSQTGVAAGEALPRTQVGKYSVAVQASDRLGQRNMRAFSYTVVGPPTVTFFDLRPDGLVPATGSNSIPSISCDSEALVSCSIVVTDPEGDLLRPIAERRLPRGLVGAYSGVAEGKDRYGQTTTRTFAYTVVAAPEVGVKGLGEDLRIPTTGGGPFPSVLCLAGGGLASCKATVTAPDGVVVKLGAGDALPHAQLGEHEFAVEAVDELGQKSTNALTYTVVAPVTPEPTTPTTPEPTTPQTTTPIQTTPEPTTPIQTTPTATTPTATTPGTTPAPTPAPAQTPAPAPSGPAVQSAPYTQLVRGCDARQFVLTDVRRAGQRVRVEGVADGSRAGRSVELFQVGVARSVGKATVGPNGLFEASLPRPRGGNIAKQNATRYYARSGDRRTTAVKLVRRINTSSERISGGQLQIEGKVTGPLTAPISPVVVRVRTSCAGGFSTLTTVTPDAKGRFRVAAAVPSGATGIAYELHSSIRAGGRTSATVTPVHGLSVG